MGKIIKYNKEAKDALKEGVDGVCDAVKVTLGAKGRNVAISKIVGEHSDNKYRPELIRIPHVTKDGVTVARNIRFADQAKDMGAKLIIEAAAKTCEDAGDGTTTTCVLAQKIIELGLEKINDGANPVLVNKGIEMAIAKAIEFIGDVSTQINGDYDLIRHVATVSANNDTEIGDIIVDAFKKVGENGVVSIEQGNKDETDIKVVNGYWYDKGFESPYFMNNPKNTCTLENIKILISDKKITRSEEITAIVQETLTADKGILIICDEIETEPLSFLVKNAANGLPICVTQAPGFGAIRKEILEDIAIATGGRYISQDKGDPFKDVKFEDLGTAEKVIAENAETKIIKGEGDEAQIVDRIALIDSLIEEEKHEFKIKQLKERKAKMSGGMAIISVGGTSETEAKERYDRMDDAVCAVYAALENGIVPGAGSTFIEARTAIAAMGADKNMDIDSGIDIVFNSLTSPFEVIISNAGIAFEDKYLELDPPQGLNVITEEIEDLYKTGIIDPAKVLISSLNNAGAAATMFLITECVIIDE